MDEKRIYAVYVDLLRLHKAFCRKKPYRAEREQFIQVINTINSKHGSCFCYMMCEALRRWFWRGMADMEIDSIPAYYSDLWHFHKEYLNKVKTDEDYEIICTEANTLSSVYGSEEARSMLLAIVADLDNN